MNQKFFGDGGDAIFYVMLFYAALNSGFICKILMKLQKNPPKTIKIITINQNSISTFGIFW